MNPIVFKEVSQDSNILLYLGALPERWDNIEIEEVFDDGENVQRCEAGQGTYFSVYLHDVNGGVQCVADCRTQADAEAVKDLLHIAVTRYKDNGFLKF